MTSPRPPLRHLSHSPAHDLEHVIPLFEHLGLGRTVRPFPQTLVWAAYVFVNGFISIELCAVLAVSTGVPFVFPSLGPTAYLLFFMPLAESSSPRNTIIGHAIGLACGYGALTIATRIPVLASTAYSGIDWSKVVAAALSLALTGALMVLLKAGHPPAGATTLIVSLGVISMPAHLLVIEAAVVVLTAQAFIINRIAGLPYPLWKHRQPDPAAG